MLVLDPDVLVVVIVVVLVVVVLVVVVLVVGVVVVATLSVVRVADPDPVVAGWVVVALVASLASSFTQPSARVAEHRVDTRNAARVMARSWMTAQRRSRVERSCCGREPGAALNGEGRPGWGGLRGPGRDDPGAELR